MYKIFILAVCLSVCVLVRCDLKEGDPCEWEGVQGKCVSPRVCLTTLDERGDKQPVCAQRGEETLICCTDCELVNDTRNFIFSPTGRPPLWKDGRVSRDKCLDYLRDLPHKCSQEGYYGGISRRLDNEKKCHLYNLWAIGGAPPFGVVAPSENPYEALMGFGKDLESAVWYTSGTIISEKFILTSADGHRTTEGKMPLKFAALGVKDRKGDKQKWQIHKVKKIHDHPDLDLDDVYDTVYYLVLLELETPITFNKDVLPACLPDPLAEFNTQTAKISSWKEEGMNFITYRDTPNIMQVEEITTVQCKKQIKAEDPPVPNVFATFLPKGINNETQTCYGNKDTCLNNIGSSVVVNNYLSRCLNTVVGVHAYRFGCGTTVFNKIAPFVPWIESVVWPVSETL